MVFAHLWRCMPASSVHYLPVSGKTHGILCGGSLGRCSVSSDPLMQLACWRAAVILPRMYLSHLCKAASDMLDATCCC